MVNLKIFLFLLSISSSVKAAQEDSKQEVMIENADKAHNFGHLVDYYEKGRKEPSNEEYELAFKYIKRDESVLDIGCGTGKSTVPLIEKFAHVKGCDWDDKMLQYAEGKAPGHFDLASVYSLPYEDETFGLVTAFSSFHWFCDDAATQEISRVLKSNGYMMVCGKAGKSTKNDTIFGEAEKILEEILDGVNITDPRENYEPIETLVRNGFEIIEIKEISNSQEYTVEEAIDYLKSRSMWNYLIKTKKDLATKNVYRNNLRSFLLIR